MRIRSITVFIDTDARLDPRPFEQAGAFVREAKRRYEDAGHEVQSTRIATQPFPRLAVSDLPRFARQAEQVAQAAGFGYLSLGPALPDDLASYRVIPDALAATSAVFFTGVMAGKAPGISLAAVRACAEVIFNAAQISPDGFGNLRFAALANVPPGVPFLPAAYHHGGAPVFALALEPAELGVAVFGAASDIYSARSELVARVEGLAAGLASVAHSLSEQLGIAFSGMDFTLAPFPEPARSTGTILEQIGAPQVGMNGSLAAAAILTEVLERADYLRAGFNGLFLPVMEDAVLAARAAQGILTVNGLLLYSAVCGTGLDCIPLPGDTTPGQLAAVLLDVAALALRLDKPLAGRLMPIPGKQAGDLTGFDFAYFANTRVMALPAAPLQRLLSSDETFDLRPRKR